MLIEKQIKTLLAQESFLMTEYAKKRSCSQKKILSQQNLIFTTINCKKIQISQTKCGAQFLLKLMN
ncbi:MAG: hypothetical protein EBZ17_14910 [Actinobacteria bacterium]|nr:hypothetical protein [Actinomycetota bacterium]